MADAFTGSNYYKRSLTEYEVEACKRDAAKRAQGCNECSLTEYEVEACARDVADAHIFTAATAMAAKIERRAELDAEITALEAEIAAAKLAQGCNECSLTEDEVIAYERDQFYAAVAAKNEHDYKLRRAELDAEIATAKTEHTDEVLVVKDAEIIALIALMAEIAAAKSNRINKLAAMDAEITALEAELAANRS